MKIHWHDANPWAGTIVYVPAEELAEAIAGGTIITTDGMKPNDAASILQRWQRHGRDAIDAYILPQPSGRHSVGVRYGSEGSQYYSPHNANPDKVQALLDKYRNQSP